MIYDKVDNKEKLTFGEFLEFLQKYGEVEFTRNHVRYMLFRLNGEITFDEWGVVTSRHEQKYRDINEFAKKANINGKLLENIWNEVTDIDYLQ